MTQSEQLISSTMRDGYQVIYLKGRLTYDNIADYKDGVKETIKDASGYVISLEGTETIDSTGLGLLVNIAKYFIYNKNKMVIVNSDDLIKEVFELTKLHKLFEIHDKMEDALKSLSIEDEGYWERVKIF